MKGKCECCKEEYPLEELDDNGYCEHCLENHSEVQKKKSTT